MKLKKKSKKDLSFILGLGGTAKGFGTMLGVGILTLQNMKDVGDIGTPVDETNLVDGTTSIYFMNEASIVLLISDLEKVRLKMKKFGKILDKDCKKLGIKFNATDNSTSRHPDKRKQVSGKRKEQ